MDEEYNVQWVKDMQKAYLATADEKISELSKAIDRYTRNPGSKDNQRRLHRLLHNLIGSGGSYGFPEVSAAAKRMSDVLKGSRSADWDEDASPLSPILETEMNNLRTAFGK